MPKTLIQFSVSANYESNEGSPICESSLTENLLATIERSRTNCELTPDDISAMSTSIRINSTHNVSELEKTIDFAVGITYDFDTVLCETSMTQNLYDAIERQRAGGAISTDDISASLLSIKITKSSAA